MSQYSSGYNIVPIAYDERSKEVSNKIIDGFDFSSKGRFLIVSSRPIPLNTRMYMEVTIISNNSTQYIRYLPIFVGIHKEPLSYGVLGSDFCLGTVYYGKSDLLMRINRPEYFTSFMVMERYNHSALTYQFINDINYKVPVINSTIGIGVDMGINTITIFVDGHEFYSFSPTKFHMNEEPENFYFAIYSSELNTFLKGIINLGRYKILYKPENWYTLTDVYYDKKKAYIDLHCRFQVKPKYENSRTAIIECNESGPLIMNNTIAPVNPNTKERKIEFIVNDEEMLSYVATLRLKHKQYGFICKIKKDNKDLKIARLKFPIPVSPKIYFLLTCWGYEYIASITNPMYGYEGIPITLIISKNNNWSEESLENYTNYAYGIDLFHKIYNRFKLHTYIEGNDFDEANDYIYSSSMPSQPQKIGVLLNLENNSILITINGAKFTELNINKEVLDFTSIYNQYWFYIVFHPELLESNDIAYVIGEFGDEEEPLKYLDTFDKNDNIRTLYDYYNYTLKKFSFVEFTCSIQVIKKINGYPIHAYLTSQVIVEDNTYEEWGPGLNLMFNTYNKVSDTESKENTPKKTTFEMLDMIEIEKENNRR